MNFYGGSTLTTYSKIVHFQAIINRPSSTPLTTVLIVDCQSLYRTIRLNSEGKDRARTCILKLARKILINSDIGWGQPSFRLVLK